MNKSMLIGAIVGAVVATAGGAFATYALVDRGPAFASVVSVDPIKETIKTPREVCKEVSVTRQRPVQDANRIAGTAVGAVVGGLLGNQVGGGNGKKIATVAGAVGGGASAGRAAGIFAQLFWTTLNKKSGSSLTRPTSPSSAGRLRPGHEARDC